MLRRSLRLLLPPLVLCAALPATGGEIAGIPSQLPPSVQRDFELSFSNDFLGRGASLDDFRTQQLLITTRVGKRWITNIDHSILTLETDDAEGRVDQLSFSMGYEFVQRRSETSATNVTAGFGVRYTGDVYGQPIQNGFHRLVSSEIELMPYTGTDQSDGTIWVDAHHMDEFYRSSSGDWSFSWWARGSSLVTSDGQWDSTLGGYIVSNYNWLDVWAGLRQDWRYGYERLVEAETADQEEDLAFVFGFRLGALIVETVQQFNNDASYGQLRLVSEGFSSSEQLALDTRFSVDGGFVVPDVHGYIAPRFRTGMFVSRSSRWSEHVVLDFRYGEPQYKDNPLLYVESFQGTVGLEWERPVTKNGWMSFYSGMGVGWRQEEALQARELGDATSGAFDSAVVTFSGGLRFLSARLGDNWQVRANMGLYGWIPIDDYNIDLDGSSVGLLKPTIVLNLGVTFDRT